MKIISPKNISPLPHALGTAWQQLPPALQAHYAANATDSGYLDISFPLWMQPLLWLLRLVGALVHRRARGVTTTVDKQLTFTQAGAIQQSWQRVLRYPDGQTIRFNSTWRSTADGAIQEFVQPFLALQMRSQVVMGKAGAELHYNGECFVVQLGRGNTRRQLRLPEWLLGHTVIVEKALDATHFHMNFRLIHPWFGEVFCYTGVFATQHTTQQTPSL